VLLSAAAAQNPEWKIYKPTNTGAQGNYSFGVAVDDSGRVWANGHDPVWDEGGLVMYDGRVWHNWSTVDSAAPDEELTSFIFDSTGNLWMGSPAGLSKFDGASWTTYNRSNVSGFPDDNVTDVDIDSSGNIWFAMGTVNFNLGGVGRFDGDSFKFWTSYTGLPWPDHWEAVACIASGPGGVVYAGSHEVGTAKWNGSSWTYLGLEAGGMMGDIVVDSTGLVWFGAASGELVSYDGSNWVHWGAPSSGIYFLRHRSAGGLWVGSPAGVHRFEGGSWASMSWPGNFCYGIAEASDGSLWAVGIGGIAHYSGGRWVLYNVANVGLSERWISGIDFDSQHNAWLSTSGGGINRFDGETWMGFNPYNHGMFPWPYLTDAVQASVEGADGNIWVGTYGQGVVVWNGSNWVRQYLQSWVIDNIVRDSAGGLWCTASSGVYHFEGDTWHRFDFLNSPLPSYVTGVCGDVDGYAWVTNLSGLFRTDGVHWEFWTPESARMPGTGSCSSPARAPDGTLWMEAAVDPGNPRSVLLHLRPQDTTWTVYDSTNSPLKACGVVAVTRQNVVWVAYFRDTYPPRGALARFDGSNWTIYDRDNSPLPNEQIADIGIDWNDNPWISCLSEGMAVIYDNPLPVEESHKPQATSPKLQVFPNPFRNNTTIRYSVLKPGPVTISVVDIAGRTVIQGRFASQSAGGHEFVWNGRTRDGKTVSAGVYFARVEAGGRSSAARLVLSR